MIPKEKIEEIRNYLRKAENPLFFFDDDSDGLCSYLILKRFTQKGKGIILKTSPNLDLSFAKKVHEHSPDLVVILDQPIISQEFIDNVHVPIIWIDHHPLVERQGVHYYNPLQYDKKDNRPVSYWAYVITKKDLWISVIGSVSDWHVPEFIDKFIEEYPELLEKKRKPEEVLFETNLGKLVRIFSFLLKGKLSEVYNAIGIIIKLETPLEVINQTTARGKFLYKRFEKMDKAYAILLHKALETSTKEKVYLFMYPSTKTSFTKELSNELVYRMQDKIVIIGREKEDSIRLSLRSMSIPIDKIVQKAIKGLEGYGGGHEFACGANVAKKDFSLFMERISSEVKKK